MILKNMKTNLSFLKKIYTDRVKKKVNQKIDEIVSNEFLTPINETLDNDIFIVGYPKSGNTWMQSLISGIYYGVDTRFLPTLLAQELVPGVHHRLFYRRYSETCFFKSHNLPDNRYRKVIYLVRDGRDAMVSYYAMNVNLGINTSLEKMIKENANVFNFKWHEHVEMWNKNPYNADIITIRYEDLIYNTLEELKRICHFIGIHRTSEYLKRVAEGASIDNMRNNTLSKNGFLHNDWKGLDAKKFFRHGEVGSYKKEMNKDLIKYFNKISKNALRIHHYDI